MKLARLLLPLALLAAPAAAQTAPAEGAVTVVLVRHAEKAAGPGADPPLSPAGEARARALAAHLADAPPTAILVTEFARTRLTAQPTAEAAGVAPRTVAARGGLRAHVDSVVAAVRALPAGSRVLVVGHSNTVPALVAALGGGTVPEICEAWFDNLFTLVLRPELPPTLEHAHYGERQPADVCAAA